MHTRQTYKICWCFLCPFRAVFQYSHIDLSCVSMCSQCAQDDSMHNLWSTAPVSLSPLTSSRYFNRASLYARVWLSWCGRSILYFGTALQSI